MIIFVIPFKNTFCHYIGDCIFAFCFLKFDYLITAGVDITYSVGFRLFINCSVCCWTLIDSSLLRLLLESFFPKIFFHFLNEISIFSFKSITTSLLLKSLPFIMNRKFSIFFHLNIIGVIWKLKRSSIYKRFTKISFYDKLWTSSINISHQNWSDDCDQEENFASRYSGEVIKSKFACLTCNKFICSNYWKT